MNADPSSHSRLAESLEQLTDIAAEAGLDPAAARDEGLRVAAALAEAVPGAATGWAEVARPGVTDLARINDAFFEAASRGRRWRAAPTDLLERLVESGHSLADEYAEALTEVASAAVMLGTAPIWVIANASAASGVYLQSARAAARPVSPVPAVAARPRGGVTRDAFGGVPSTDGAITGGGPTGGDTTGGDTTGSDAAPTSSASTASTGTAAAQQAAEPQKTVEELLAELDEMIGLDRVKREVHRQVALLTVEKLRTEAGLKAPKMSRHLVFVGNPGTGKTTVARLIGAIYRALDLLPQGQLVEVDRSELVAGYVGQTAMKTAEVCAKADGGVLFIDEAYALIGDQYAQEAVNTLVKEMEDRRQTLVVIVAGYPDPMAYFIAQNPGLASRFTTTIEFDDYTDDELLRILDAIAEGNDYALTEEAHERVRDILSATPRTLAFGNGRFSRNLFEHAVGRHAWRLRDSKEPTRDELRLLTADDFIDRPDVDPDDVEDGVKDEVKDEVRDGTDEVRDDVRAEPDGPGPGDEAVSHEQTDEQPDEQPDAQPDTSEDHG